VGDRFPLLSAIFGTALASRLALLLWKLGRDPALLFQPDSPGYWILAGNLAEQGVFSAAAEPPWVPDHYRTPAYPLFLALFRLGDASPWVPVLAQVLLSAGLACLAGWCALRLAGRRAGLAAGLLVALDAPSAVMSTLVMTETLFTLLVAGAALLCHLAARRQGLPAAAGSGVLAGWAALTRPSALGLAAVLSLLLVLRPGPPWRFRLTAALLLLAGTGLVAVPWIARNRARVGAPILASVGYDNVLFVQGAAVLSVVEGRPYPQVRARLEAEFAASPEASLDLESQGRAKLRRARAIFRAHPLVFLRNLTVAAANTLFRPLRRDFELLLGRGDTPLSLQAWGGESGLGLLRNHLRSAPPALLLLLLLQVVHLATLYGGTLAALLRRPPALPPALLVLLVAVAGYLVVTTSAPESYGRFRTPLVPFLAVLAGAGLGGVTTLRQRMET
jgi:4-amino-4-deoxy-L-arabinose transferase-like glycosyltransferase